MAALLGAQEVMRALAAALQLEQDLPFAAALVQALNLILLTAPEVGCWLQAPAMGAAQPAGAGCSCAWHRLWEGRPGRDSWWSKRPGAQFSLCT